MPPCPKSRAGQRRLALLAAVVLLAAAVRLISPLWRQWTAVVMLFTQRSVQPLAGALRAAGGWALLWGWFLAAFRAAVLPWFPRLLPVAQQMVFGGAGGWAAALVGEVLAAGFCWLVGRLAAGDALPLRLRRQAAIRGWLWCCLGLLALPGANGLVGYLAGAAGVPWRRFMPAAAASEAAVLLAVSRLCSPYAARLPLRGRLILAAAAAALAAGTFLWHFAAHAEKGRTSP